MTSTTAPVSTPTPTANRRPQIDPQLDQRVRAHLEPFGLKSIRWTGKGSFAALFNSPLTPAVTALDTRFEPLMLNWTQTFRATNSAIYLNVPATWRAETKGEGSVANELTPLMRELLEHMADGAIAIQGRSEAVNGDRVYGFAANSLTGLIKRGLVSKLGDMERYVINPAGRAAINRPIDDPTAPILANEIENADEPCGDVGTLIDPEPANNLPDVQPAPLPNPLLKSTAPRNDSEIERAFRAGAKLCKECKAVYEKDELVDGLCSHCRDERGLSDIQPSRSTSAFRPSSKNTPVRDQYLAFKADYPSHLMLFQLGDFYELFDQDAETVASELNFNLSKRPTGNKDEMVSMVGIPEPKLDSVIDELIKRGFDVVTVVQMNAPNVRGLADRRVDRIVEAKAVETESTPEPEQPAALIGCPLCGNASMIPVSIRTIDPVKCPVCGKFSARWEWQEDNSVLTADPYEWFTVGDRAVRKSDNAEIVITDVDGDFISGTGTLYGEVEVGLIRHGNGTYSKSKEYAHTPVTVARVHRKHFCRPRTGEWGVVEPTPEPEPEQLADPIYQDYIGALLRVNDWVQTPAGLRGAIVGFKQDRTAVVALMSEFKSFDASTDIHDYLAHTLRRIDPPAPKPDPINYDAYNGGLADAALASLEQADIERAAKADPYAWATPDRRAEVAPIIEKLTPMEFHPTSKEGVWLIEDAVTAKTMRKGLARFGVIILSVEEDEIDGEPYTIARFNLGAPIETPFPSKRQTKPVPMANSIYAQHDALKVALPKATQLLIQLSGDEWVAFGMDATLLRRYAPLCQFTACAVNERGEQWDKLIVPAGILDECLTEATEGGLTVALASIVRDELFTLPVREVTEIHAPGEPVQYVGKEAAPEETDEEADVDTEPVIVPAPVVNSPKIEMTPELMAAKIKLRIHGGLRLGLVEVVNAIGDSGAFSVWFVHPMNTFTMDALKAEYDDVAPIGRFCVSLRPKSAPLGDVLAQAAAVIAETPSLEPEPEAAPTVELLSADAERALISALMLEHADLNDAAFGMSQFLLNVIARLRAGELAAQPF